MSSTVNYRKLLGWGDPTTAKIWFAGLEEATQESKSHEEVASRFQGELLDGLFQAFRGCGGSAHTSVYDIISKIVVGLKYGDYSHKWREYRDEHLFEQSGDVVQVNLFSEPIKEHADKSDSSKDADIREGRLAAIDEIRNKYHDPAPLLVCFGQTSRWRYARASFGLDGEGLEDPGGLFRLYGDQRIILTPFFTPAYKLGLSNERVNALIEWVTGQELNPWRHR